MEVEDFRSNRKDGGANLFETFLREKGGKRMILKEKGG